MPTSVLFERQSVFALELPFGQQMQLVCHRFVPRWTPSAPGVTVLAGLHGDELDGSYICHLLSQFLQNLPASWRLEGTVTVLPNANPPAGRLGERFMEVMGSDLNRNFPGNPEGNACERLAAAIFSVASQSNLCIDIHSSNRFLEELPQARIVDDARLQEWAACIDLDVVWAHSPHNWIGGTIAQALFERNVPTLVVELGTGCRIRRSQSERVFRGIVQLLLRLGILSGGSLSRSRPPLQANEFNVVYVNSETGGMFLPRAGLNLRDRLRRGSVLGQVIDPLTGQQSEVVAPLDGVLFTLRVHPVVYAGSLVARLVHC